MPSNQALKSENCFSALSIKKVIWADIQDEAHKNALPGIWGSRHGLARHLEQHKAQVSMQGPQLGHVWKHTLVNVLASATSDGWVAG